MWIYLCALFRDSFRYWSRKPWQVVLSVPLLALGSAAVAVLWTVTDVVVRQPLPFPESEELYGFQSVDEKSGKVLDAMALADFRDFRERQSSFEELFAYRGDFLNYREASGTTRQLAAARVTRGFAKVLRVRSHIGRLFEDQDFASSEGSVAVISYDLWQREFSGEPSAVGSSMWFDGRAFQVVGVMPKSYNEPAFADVWTPFPDMTGEYFVRDARYWSVVGRLKPDVSLAAALAETKGIAAALAEENPDTNRSRSARLDTLQNMLVGDYSSPLVLISVAVSLVMLATCLNLANLRMIDGLQRRAEIGIRQAIGESPGLAFGRALLEAGALCVVGCAIGYGLAAAFLANIGSILPDMFLPRLHEIGVSASLAWTILVIALAASVSFGLLPALQATRFNTSEVLKSGDARHGQSAGSLRSRNVLLALQIAISVLILHGALLVVHGYKRLESMDLGFRSENLTLLTVSPGASRMFDLPALGAYYDEMVDWVSARDGVLAATTASSPPLWGFELDSVFSFVGRDIAAERDEAVMAVYNSVSPDFFDTIGVKIAAGRSFEDLDTRDSQRVAIVNEAFARKYLPDVDPLLQQIFIQTWMEPRPRQIVGVASDYVQTTPSAPSPPQVYVPYSQTPWIFTTVVVRTQSVGDGWQARLEQEMKQRFPDLGVTVVTMDQLLERQFAIHAAMYVLFVGFGVATLALSVFGIGSQMAFNVSDRSREWGIRLALGATRRQLSRLVVGDALKPIAMGIVVGLALFAASYRFHAGFGETIDAGFASSSAATLAGVVGIGALVTWLVSSRMTAAQPQANLKSD